MDAGSESCVCGSARNVGGESSKFSPEKERSNITTFQVRLIIFIASWQTEFVEEWCLLGCYVVWLL
jgi:hypothetical protein